MPAKINTTGIPEIDQTTAELAVHLRDSGMTEKAAIAEAQRIRDTLLGAAAEFVAGFHTDAQHAADELRALTGGH